MGSCLPRADTAPLQDNKKENKQGIYHQRTIGRRDGCAIGYHREVEDLRRAMEPA